MVIMKLKILLPVFMELNFLRSDLKDKEETELLFQTSQLHLTSF